MRRPCGIASQPGHDGSELAGAIQWGIESCFVTICRVALLPVRDSVGANAARSRLDGGVTLTGYPIVTTGDPWLRCSPFEKSWRLCRLVSMLCAFVDVVAAGQVRTLVKTRLRALVKA
jgi:hypothetical protein